MRKLTTLLLLCTAIFANAQNDYYWVGGAGGWMDSTEVNGTMYMTHWAKDELGANKYTRSEFSTYFTQDANGDPVFLPNSMTGTVYFGNQSGFNDKDTIRMDFYDFSGSFRIRAIDAQGLDKEVFLIWDDYLNYNGAYPELIFSSSTYLSPGLTINSDFSTISFELDSATSTVFFDPNGSDIGELNVWVYASSASYGTFHLLDSLACNWITIDGGAIELNDQPIYANRFYVDSYTESISLSASNIYINDGFVAEEGDGMLDATDATIFLNQEEGSSAYFRGYGQSFGTVIIQNEGAVTDIEGESLIDSLVIRGKVEFDNNNTINHTVAQPGSQLIFDRSDTLFINESFIAEGSDQQFVSLASATYGDAAILQFDSIQLISSSIKFATIQDITVRFAGGGLLEADSSYDVSNNKGFTFNDVIKSRDFYWRGGSSDNWDDRHNWTNGPKEIVHYTSPFLATNVIFDESSFSGPDTVYLPASIDIKSLDASALDEEVVLLMEGTDNAINLHGGSMTLHTNLTMDTTVHLSFISESDDITLTTAGNAWYKLTIDNEEDVTLTLQDSLAVSTDINFRSGDFDLNNQSVWTGDAFNSSGTSTADDLLMTASSIYCERWNPSGGNPSLDSDMSELFINGNYFNVDGDYHNVTIRDGSEVCTIRSSATFNDLTIDPGTEIEYFSSGISLTVTGDFSASGDGTAEGWVSIDGNGGTLSAVNNDVSLQYVRLRDVIADVTTGKNYAADIVADLGGNTGWTLTNTLTNEFYWVGGHSENWEDPENWATESGGSSLHPIAPNGSSANVYFDAASFAEDDTVRLLSSVDVGKLDWSGLDQQVDFIVSNERITAFDTVYFTENVLISNRGLELTLDASEGPIAFYPTSDTLDDLTITGAGLDTVRLMGNVNAGYLFLNKQGILHSGSYDHFFESNNVVSGSAWDMGSSTITTYDAQWFGNHVNLNPATKATIKVLDPGGVIYFNGSNQTYHRVFLEADIVQMRGANNVFLDTLAFTGVEKVELYEDWTAPSDTAFAPTGILWYINGSTNGTFDFISENISYDKVSVLLSNIAVKFYGTSRFDSLSLGNRTDALFESGATQSVGVLVADGSSGVLDLSSTTAGLPATLVFDDATQVKFANIQDLAVSTLTGAPVNAYYSQNISGNTGWTFIDIELTYTPSSNAILDLENPQLQVDFSEPVNLGDGTLAVYDEATDQLVAEIAQSASVDEVSSVTYDLNPADFSEGSYYVIYPEAFFTDDNSGDLPAIVKGDWVFEVAYPAATASGYSPFGGAALDLDHQVLTIEFDTDVVAGSGNLTVHQESDDAIVETIAASDLVISGTTVTAALSFVDASTEGDYYVLYEEGIVEESSFGKKAEALTDKAAWTFTVTLPAATVVSYTPTSGSRLSLTTPSLTMKFDQAVAAGTGSLTVYRAADDAVVETFASTALTIDGATATVTFTDLDNLTDGFYYVQYPDGYITESTYGKATIGISTKNDWTFEVDRTSATVMSYSPNGAALDLDHQVLTIEFDTDVVAGSGNLTVHQESDDAVVETIAASDLVISGTTVTAALSFVDASAEGDYYVLYEEGIVEESSFGKKAEALTDKAAWTFTVEQQPLGLASRNQVVIYPNPAQNEVRLNLQGLDVQQVQLLNSSGKLLLRVEGETLDTGNLSDGIYFIKVIHSEGQEIHRMVKRSVKQR